MSIMPFDELNAFKEQLPIHFDSAGHIRSKEDEEDIIDELLDLFLLAYANGQASVNDSLGSTEESPLSEVMEVIDREVAGKTWRERIGEYFDNGGTMVDIIRIAETETHRDSNEAAYITAVKAGATRKTWNTVLDDRVREDHEWLQGVTAPIDGYFYSPQGDRTLFPGQWGVAEQDVNCRCYLTFS